MPYTYVVSLDVASGKRRVLGVRFPIPGSLERYLKYRIVKCEGELPPSFKDDPLPSGSKERPVATVAPFLVRVGTSELDSQWESSEADDSVGVSTDS